MSRQNAQISFDSFISTWKRPFEQVQSALDVLKSFPYVEPILRLDLADGNQLAKTQYDWLSLQPRLAQKERTFFNPAWVPIENQGVEAFVDLTQDRLPVFTTLYSPFGGGTWKKVPFVDSLRTLMRAAPRSSELRELREKAESSFMKAAQGDLFEKGTSFPHPLEARTSGFLPEADRLFFSGRVTRKMSRLPGNHQALVVEPVSPLALALFPPGCELSLDHFDFAPTLFEPPQQAMDFRPRGVATLIAHLQKPGMPRLSLMSGTLHHPQFDVRFRWENGTFTLSQAPYQVMWYFDSLIDVLRRDRKKTDANV